MKQNKIPALDEPQLRKSFKIKARDFVRAGEVSLQVQRILKNIGFEEDLVRRVAICAYESEMNLVLHGGDGDLMLTVHSENIVLDVTDNGPGIDDIELALQEGYSTATSEQREMGFGAGMGLPNIEKNADSLEVSSEKGAGTNLKITLKASKDGGEVSV
jgi:serine/threonine-protein kinase RsbT